jgi:hypothetical protein
MAAFTRTPLVKHAWMAQRQRTVTAGYGHISFGRRGGTVTRTRQVILAIVVIFILYAIYTNPAASANAARAIWNVIVSAFQSIFSFFNHLINGR